jgi:hypothetical protein
VDIPNILLPSRLSLGAGYRHGEYVLTVKDGVTPAHVVDPGFWLHVAPRLKRHDRIEVIAEDGSFDMDVRVIAVDARGLYARVRVLRYCDGDGVAVPGVEPAQAPEARPLSMPDQDGYLIEPDSAGWRIVRGPDQIEGRLSSEAAAKAKLADIKAAQRRKVA